MWNKVILLVAVLRLWRPLLRIELMIEVEDCMIFHQVMVWFEFYQWKRLWNRRELKEGRIDNIPVSPQSAC